VASVREADRNEVLKELVESFDVTGRVGRKVTRPLDGPLEGGIRSAVPMNEPPVSRFENHCRICRRLLDGKPTGTRPNSFVDIYGIDVTRLRVRDIDLNNLKGEYLFYSL